MAIDYTKTPTARINYRKATPARVRTTTRSPYPMGITLGEFIAKGSCTTVRLTAERPSVTLRAFR